MVRTAVPARKKPRRTKYLVRVKNLRRGAAEEEKRGNKGVCVDFLGRTRSMRHLVSTLGRGSSSGCGVFRHLEVCAWNPGLVTSSASFRWVVRGNFSLTAGAASNFPLEVRRRRPRSAARQSGGLCVKVPVAPQAPRRSFPCEVKRWRPGSACCEFFTTGQAVRHF
ncbi:hypothetical protein NDU88_005966 [Pleurodeles waltl]|uniref:Uncharacterized protein n=1 Tax=Pleurodeles waltl TaxID=8319 RepID=A0AAV7X054_PLEWA|nr:hypothetical protein NDU88_005966 [Pleurodeles waltl]